MATPPDILPRPAGAPLTPGGPLARSGAASFEVHLDVFSGPFELLLGLIAKHRLDITEVALAQVTDEFLAHLSAASATEDGWDLSEASEFLLVAATLLDLKASRLLPSDTGDDEEDLALLEARDLLFARLLQYRAFKALAATFAEAMAAAAALTPRPGGLERRFAGALPELVLTLTPDDLARLAARALRPKPVPTVSVEHLHAPAVSVREQAAVLLDQLRRRGVCSFRLLVAGAAAGVVVARFLALLELFAQSLVAFEQAEPLGELTVRWTGHPHG